MRTRPQSPPAASVPQRPARGRGRRPIADVHEDVLQAANELLDAEGISGVTYERLSRLSGVSKTTLYKLWPSIGALAMEAHYRSVSDALAFDETLNVRDDVLRQLRAFVQVLNTRRGRTLLELIGASQTDPDLAQALRSQYSAARRQKACTRLKLAQENGEIRAGIDVRVLIDQLWGSVYHRLLIPDEPVDDAFIKALVDNLFGGIATVHLQR